jgi:hypothetical protein
MIIDFKYGFEYNGFLFGWHKKELYRLPSVSKGKSYGIKKLSIIKVGNDKGYRVKREKMSIKKIVEMTLPIEVAIKLAKDKKNIPLI